MTLESMIGVIVSVAILAYLVFTLLRPERF